MKSPYQLRVVLHVAEHRMLTPLFQKQLETDVRDQLQLALGKLGTVQVVRGHPLISDIRSKGLQSALDSWDELSSTTTCFALIDFTDGKYEIRTGQHDGMTGLSSPVVRRVTLSDRQRVADAVVQMVRKDFGVVGSFQKLSDKEVKLAIKGGGLVDSVEPWVKIGDVFSVVRITEDSGKLRASPIEWAILHVAELLPDGFVRCRYFCRYAGDHELEEGGPKDGYRCLKLSTVQGQVKVRLVDKKTQEFLPVMRVEISATADFKNVRDKDKGTTFKGLFESAGLFTNVAFVRVYAGATPLVEFPVALVDDRVVVCRMSPTKAAEEKGEIEQRKDRWVRWCVEALSFTDHRLSELNADLSAEAAIQLATQHQKEIAAEATRLASERAELVNLAGKHKMALDLGTGEQFTATLEKRQAQLAKYIDDLDKLIKEANSLEMRELIAAVKRAQLLEKQAEFDKAIELYELVVKSELIAKVRDGVEIKAHVEQLKQGWAIKTKDHAGARQFIYTVWPKLDPREMKTQITEAEKSFNQCKQAGDRRTPLKLQLSYPQQAMALAKELDVLRKAPDSEDNRAKLKAMLQLVARLQSLQAQVEAWIANDKNAGK